MTVQDTASQITIIADGVLASFPFNFRVDDVTWLTVDFLMNFDQFSLNADQDASPGGTIDYAAPPPNLTSITLTRLTPLVQNTDYTRYDAFDSESHEGALDKLTMEIQDRFLLLGSHIADLNIHFPDAPADGSYYSRRDNAWEVPPFALPTDHSALLNIGVNTHLAIDAHINSTAIHFGDAPANGSQYARRDNAWEIVGIISDHTLLSNIGVNDHVAIDAHIADSNIHFSDAPVDNNPYARRNNAWQIVAAGGVTDHTLLTNIGINSHAAIDAFIIAATAQHIASAAHIGDGTIHFTEALIDHVNILNVGVNTHAQIDTQLTALALRARGITVENPIANDNFTLFFTNVQITVQQLNFVLQGATNVTVFVSFGPDRNALGTDVINAGTIVSNITVGQEITVFDNAVIPAANWVAVRITAITATPDELNVSVVYN